MRNFTIALGIAASLLVIAPVDVAKWTLSAAEAAPAIDPTALAAARRMGGYLRTLKSFEIVSSATVDLIDDDGVKIVVPMNTTYKIRRPDAFLIEMTTDKKARRFFYDGKSFTVFAPKVGYFASISAPATIAETVDLIYEGYGIVLPLADLFYWGTEAEPTDRLTSARSLGAAKIGGVQTDHFAYAGAHYSWEVWITRGEKPLPRKMVITTIDDPAKPRFTANLTWTPSTTFEAAAFTFNPTANVKPIAMARIDQ